MSIIARFLPVFDWVLWTSAKVSVLIIFLLFIKYLFRNKLGATVNYLLWSVVIAGLLLPLTPSSPLSIYNLAGLATENLTQNSIANSDAANISPILKQSFSESITIPALSEVAAGKEFHSAVTEPEAQKPISLRSIAGSPLTHLYLFLVWLLGVVVFSICTIVVNHKFARSIQGRALKHWHLLDSLERIRVLAQFERLKDRLHIKGDVSLLLTEAVGTPSLFGLWKPRLLLPLTIANSFSTEQLNHVFVHELIHFKCKDIIVNWLVQVLLILHWFNPLIWYAFGKLREDQESACDALTVSCLGEDNAKNYASTLIKLLESYTPPCKMAGLAGLSGSKSVIKRRIIRISQGRQSSLAFTIIIMAIVILTGFSTLADAKSLPAAEDDPLALQAAAPHQTTAKPSIPALSPTGFFSGGIDQQAIDLFIASVQTVAISDDSPAGNFWSTQNENTILTQLSSWLKDAIPYTGTIPHSVYVDDVVHHNIGPAALHLTGPHQFATLIYPAWYIQTNGREVAAASLEEDRHYQENVIVLIEGGTNSIYYFYSAPLYHWLKSGEWKTEFSPNTALAPLYGTNENSQTYGTDLSRRIMGNPQPDLLAAVNQDGIQGYIKYEDLMGPQPRNPEEAAAMQKAGLFKKREIPLYAADGKTVLGSF